MKPTSFTDIKLLVAKCRELGYPIDETGRPSLLFVEGMTDTFGQIGRPVDRFSDACVLYQYVDGEPSLLMPPSVCTVSPGLESMRRAAKNGLVGAALLDKGYHKEVWELGYHKANTQGKNHPALVQVAPTRFHRDVNRNWLRDDKNLQVGLRGLNIHRASRFQNLQDIGIYSAGCLVFQNYSAFSKFMLILYTWLSANKKATKRWSATILAVEDQSGMWVNHTTA